MLKERGQYVLNLHNGDSVTFKFNTYCFLKFCELSGDITYTEMLDLLANNLKLKSVVNLLKAASGFDATDEEVSGWIDELGGIAGANFIKVIQTATEALVDKGQKEEPDNGKKKAGKS